MKPRRTGPRRGADPKAERAARDGDETRTRVRDKAIEDPKGNRVVVERVTGASPDVPRKPRYKRSDFAAPTGEERPFRRPREDGERREGGRDERPRRDGERPDRKPFGERKPYGERKAFGDRPPRKEFGDRPPGGEGRPARKPFGEGRSGGKPGFGGKGGAGGRSGGGSGGGFRGGPRKPRG